MSNTKSNPADMLFKQLAESLSFLAREMCASREQRTIELEWFKSHFQSVTKQDLKEMEKRIMATQAELAAQLTADLKTANSQLKKLITDTSGLQPAVDELKLKISELEALIAAGGSITQDMIDLAAETKALTQTVDDNVPELPQPPV